jgi:hypothetical protein
MKVADRCSSFCPSLAVRARRRGELTPWHHTTTRTYLSENALLPTHADTQFGSEEARGIYAYNTGYQSFLSKLAKDNVLPQEASRYDRAPGERAFLLG